MDADREAAHDIHDLGFIDESLSQEGRFLDTYRYGMITRNTDDLVQIRLIPIRFEMDFKRADLALAFSLFGLATAKHHEGKDQKEIEPIHANHHSEQNNRNALLM